MLHQKEALICWLLKFVHCCTIFWCFYRNFLPFSGVTHHPLWYSLNEFLQTANQYFFFLQNRTKIFQNVLSQEKSPQFQGNVKDSTVFCILLDPELENSKLRTIFLAKPHQKSRARAITSPKRYFFRKKEGDFVPSEIL